MEFTELLKQNLSAVFSEGRRMLYFSFADYLYAALLALLHGALFGGLFGILLISLRKIKDILKIPKRAYLLSFNVTRENIRGLHFNSLSINKTLQNVLEFIYFTIYGISLILLNYAILDGTPRALILIVSTVSFYLTYKYPTRYFEAVLCIAVDKLLRVITVTVSVVIIPVRILAGGIYRFILRCIKCVLSRVKLSMKKVIGPKSNKRKAQSLAKK